MRPFGWFRCAWDVAAKDISICQFKWLHFCNCVLPIFILSWLIVYTNLTTGKALLQELRIHWWRRLVPTMFTLIWLPIKSLRSINLDLIRQTNVIPRPKTSSKYLAKLCLMKLRSYCKLSKQISKSLLWWIHLTDICYFAVQMKTLGKKLTLAFINCVLMKIGYADNSGTSTCYHLEACFNQTTESMYWCY